MVYFFSRAFSLFFFSLCPRHWKSTGLFGLTFLWTKLIPGQKPPLPSTLSKCAWVLHCCSLHKHKVKFYLSRLCSVWLPRSSPSPSHPSSFSFLSVGLFEAQGLILRRVACSGKGKLGVKQKTSPQGSFAKLEPCKVVPISPVWEHRQHLGPEKIRYWE